MIFLSTGLRNAMLDSTGFRAALAFGVIYVFDGSQPDSADAPVQGNLLGKITVDAAAFEFGTHTNGLSLNAPVAGVISKDAGELWQMTGIYAGLAGWFRFMGNVEDDLGTSTILPRMDGSIANSGGDFRMSNTSIVVGRTSTYNVFQYTLPKS